MEKTNTVSYINIKIDKLMIDFQKELSTEAMHALQNLRKHSECLSDIPPHFGSNKNERLHREIRAWFKNRTTVNLETALAILLINFTLWNRGKKGDNRPIMTESLGKLDQLHVPMFEMNEVDEVSVFDTNVGYVDIPEDLPLEILKLIGNLECFTFPSCSNHFTKSLWWFFKSGGKNQMIVT